MKKRRYTSSRSTPVRLRRGGPAVVETLEPRRLLTAAVPRFDHVVVVMEENKAYSNIIGSASAPYINSLALSGALFTNSFAIGHPSQPNYLALFSGSNQGSTSDTPPSAPYTTANLGAELLAAHDTFTGYSESMPAAGFLGTSQGNYYRKHNPWSDWQSATAGGNFLPAAVNQPFTAFPTDFTTLPTVSFVVPNQLNDMHDGTIAMGDAWLQTNMQAYANWATTHNSLLIVTWDEDDNSSANHIPTLFAGAGIKAGSYAESINHFSVLHTIEDAYGLPAAGASASAPAITDVWSTATQITPTSTAVKSSNVASTFGQSVTFTATVAPQGSGTPTGTVQFQIDGSNLGAPVALTGGSAAFTTATLAAGTPTISAVYSGNAAFGASSSPSITQDVMRATPALKWPAPAPIALGTALGPAQLNASSTVPGIFVYSPAAGVVPSAGTQTLSVTFAPTDSTDFTSATASVNLVVVTPGKITPSINWPTPAAIVYGTPLGDAQYNASASVSGSFIYSIPAGTVLHAGTQALSVTFMPADSTTYSAATASVSLIVNKATPVLTWLAPTPIVYGTPLGAAQLSAAATVPGAFVYGMSAGTILQAGTHNLSVAFTPADSADYIAATASVSLIVHKATPVLTWPAPTPIVYGTPLGAAQLSAAALVPGTFVYGMSTGTILHAGTHNLSVAFTPADSADYIAATASVNLLVNKAVLNVRADDQQRAPGAANPRLTYQVSNFVNGDTSKSISGAPALATAATAASPSGAYPITIAAGTLASADYTFDLTPGNLLVTVGSTRSAITTIQQIALPTQVVAGQRIKARSAVTLANGGAKLAGLYTVNLYADTQPVLDDSKVLVASKSRRLSLKHGGRATFGQLLKVLPATLAAGDYYLIAEVVDPSGMLADVTPSQTVRVQTPVISLGLSLTNVKPESIEMGRSGSIAVMVSNSGNVNASGLLALMLSASNDAVSAGTSLANARRKTKIAAGHSKTFVVHFKTSSLAAGAYIPSASISLQTIVASATGASFKVI